MFLLALAAALLASVLFNIGIALQALEARRAPRSLGLRLSLLGRLLRRPRWLLGQVLGTVGVGPQVYAFAHAPFVAVQPLLAVGLLVLLALGAHALGEEVGFPEIIGVVAIIAGVTLVAWGAPQHSETHRGGLAVIGVAALLTVAAFVPFLLKKTRWDAAMVTIVASGCGFAGTNVATKLMSDDIKRGHYLQVGLWAALGLLLGLAATVTGMSAFQRRTATVVVPVSTAVQTFLPILLEPLFLHERWGSVDYGGAPIAVGLLVACAGTILLARTRAVADLAAGAQGQ